MMLPHLDTTTFVLQAISVSITFVATWSIVSFVIIPRITNRISERLLLMQKNKSTADDLLRQLADVIATSDGIVKKASEEARRLIDENRIIVQKKKEEEIDNINNEIKNWKAVEEEKLQKEIHQMTVNATKIVEQISSMIIEKTGMTKQSAFKVTKDDISKFFH